MRTAIVIDDDIDTIDVMIELLEINQISVIGKGYNGLEAVELYKKLRPDVILLDVAMPDYDGIYALENIKKINQDANVIIITGDTTQGSMDKLRELKPSAIFSKPMETSSVIRAVNNLIVEAIST
jgi:two-component system, chemotaxis family, chemotaxis protein CheY